jgi:hypothetical protein
MRKGVAVPYIIALILGIAVVALVGYWFFVIGGGLPGQAGETQCRAKLSMYCNAWSGTGYVETPDGEEFSGTCPASATYAPECCSFSWARSVTQTVCEAALGQT